LKLSDILDALGSDVIHLSERVAWLICTVVTFNAHHKYNQKV